MADRLSAITRPNGKTYQPRKITVQAWENDDAWSELNCGAVVLGTQDLNQATPLATDSIKRWYDNDLTATRPEVGWFRLGIEYSEFRWVRDEVRGRAGVMFTADYPAASGAAEEGRTP